MSPSDVLQLNGVAIRLPPPDFQILLALLALCIAVAVTQRPF